MSPRYVDQFVYVGYNSSSVVIESAKGDLILKCRFIVFGTCNGASMGINIEYIPFFDVCYKNVSLMEPFLSLGSLEIHDSVKDIEEYASQNGYNRLFNERTVSALLLERFGVKEYLDVDINDAAQIKLDLTKEIPKNMLEKFNTVLDGGTLEHVFDVAKALENIHNMTAIGGVIVHLTPLTWYEHGLYNFNPRFYDLISTANSYKEIAEGYYFRKQTEARTLSAWISKLLSKEPPIPEGLKVTSVLGKPTKDADIVKEAMLRRLLPSSVLYLRAYQKVKDGSFNRPYDIQP